MAGLSLDELDGVAAGESEDNFGDSAVADLGASPDFDGAEAGLPLLLPADLLGAGAAAEPEDVGEAAGAFEGEAALSLAEGAGEGEAALSSAAKAPTTAMKTRATTTITWRAILSSFPLLFFVFGMCFSLGFIKRRKNREGDSKENAVVSLRYIEKYTLQMLMNDLKEDRGRRYK